MVVRVAGFRAAFPVADQVRSCLVETALIDERATDSAHRSGLARDEHQAGRFRNLDLADRGFERRHALGIPVVAMHPAQIDIVIGRERRCDREQCN